MTRKSFTLTTPPAFQCYNCMECGACCRGRFAIIITRADRDRVLQQGWSDDELGLNGAPLFTPRGDGFQLAHQSDGSCIFLDNNGRCRIHARFGEPAKPLPCRLYPFRFVPLGSQVRVDVRFDCPATASNFGKPIPGYRSELLTLMGQVIPEQAAALSPPPLYASVAATWAQLSRVTETFERFLTTSSLELTRRVLGCVTLAALLRSPRIVSLEGRKLSEFLETVAEKVLDAAAQDALQRVPPPAMVRTAFRQIAGVYGRLDQVGEALPVMTRFRHSLSFVFGKGTVPALQAGFPTVSFADIDAMQAPLTPDGAAISERYLHLRLVSMGFFGRSFYQRSYLDGMSALLLTYPLISWYARLFALGKGLTEPNAACVERAVQVVDHQHGITPVLNLPSERYRTGFLCERSHLRSLVIWYG